MKKSFDFSGVKPKEVVPYQYPVIPEAPGRLSFAGGSEIGSHSMAVAMKCARAFWYGRGGHYNPPPSSDGSSRVAVLPDLPGEVVVEGPVQANVTLRRGETVWMARGTLVHVALAHHAIRGALAQDGSIVVGGQTYTSTDGGSPWYTPGEAVESAAALMGPGAHTYGLSAGRRMLPQLEQWMRSLIQREQPIAVETQIAWHVPGPWIYTARLDLITRNRASGTYRIWDYKTGRSPVRDKSKYSISAQLHGQQEMGRRLFGELFGGVHVALIEDPDDPKKVGSVEEWSLPFMPTAVHLESSIVDAQCRMLAHVEQLKLGIQRVPGSPFFCAGCNARERCFAGT